MQVADTHTQKEGRFQNSDLIHIFKNKFTPFSPANDSFWLEISNAVSIATDPLVSYVAHSIKGHLGDVNSF